MHILNGNDVHSILNTGANILVCKVRIVIPDDPIKRSAVPDQFQNILYGYSGSSDTRLAEVDPGFDFDSVSHADLQSFIVI